MLLTCCELKKNQMITFFFSPKRKNKKKEGKKGIKNESKRKRNFSFWYLGSPGIAYNEES